MTLTLRRRILLTVAPLVVLLAAQMICAAFSVGFDSFYPLKVLAVSAALLWFRQYYSIWSWSWSWFARCRYARGIQTPPWSMPL